MKCHANICWNQQTKDSGFCQTHKEMLDSNDYGIIQCWNCSSLVRFFLKKDKKFFDHKYTFCSKCRKCGGKISDENLVKIHPEKDRG